MTIIYFLKKINFFFVFCDLNCPSKANLKSVLREDESSLLSVPKNMKTRVFKLLWRFLFLLRER